MRNRKPISDTQAVERILGELHRQREARPDRMTPHEGYGRLRLKVEEIGDELREIDTGADRREIGLALAALAVRFLVECT